ncbi:MAG: AraC family transcriptional regulator [Pseudomonadota bacterium]
MEDFASSAMMRLVGAGLRRQGIAPSGGRPEPGGHVALASKRAALLAIAEHHGPLALLRIGEAIEDVGDEPTLAALEPASDPLEIIERWRRLEGYVHSKHRTEILESDERSVVVRHHAYRGSEPPLREEDLLIFGVIVALVRWVGASGVRATPVGETQWCYQDEWIVAPSSASAAAWTIEWADVDEERSKIPVGNSSLADLLREDLSRKWSVAQAALALGKSARSLQRELGEAGMTYSQVVASVRAAAAMRMLQSSKRSLGEIGFLCGYADQAHFTRSFRNEMAATPSDIRAGLEVQAGAR